MLAHHLIGLLAFWWTDFSSHHPCLSCLAFEWWAAKPGLTYIIGAPSMGSQHSPYFFLETSSHLHSLFNIYFPFHSVLHKRAGIISILSLLSHELSLTYLWYSTHFCLKNEGISWPQFLFVLWLDPSFGKPTCDAWFLEIRVCGSFLAQLLSVFDLWTFPYPEELLPWRKKSVVGRVGKSFIRRQNFYTAGVRKGKSAPNSQCRVEMDKRGHVKLSRLPLSLPL